MRNHLFFYLFFQNNLPFLDTENIGLELCPVKNNISGHFVTVEVLTNVVMELKPYSCPCPVSSSICV